MFSVRWSNLCAFMNTIIMYTDCTHIYMYVFLVCTKKQRTLWVHEKIYMQIFNFESPAVQYLCIKETYFMAFHKLRRSWSYAIFCSYLKKIKHCRDNSNFISALSVYSIFQYRCDLG